MDDTRLENIPPLGRSVEDVEADTQNRVNPPARDNASGAGDTNSTNVVAPLPIVNPSATGVQGTVTSHGAPIIGTYAAGTNFAALQRDEADPTTAKGVAANDSTDDSQA
ncbi:hypothetical protein [Deinococcus yavapaiensis]|uniref:Uncharacterized protein n=1 Tax=Deinococcus yavapaiensis KR-236 TaxID=694435 RepID=A0A318S8N6_9DEIO|nr:hypothetical protein [Deinococcus yavapaiensis]PYE53393.1 hypothetical protein DES52_109170 [Deinococcus yavapaiensis KR-236]